MSGVPGWERSGHTGEMEYFASGVGVQSGRRDGWGEPAPWGSLDTRQGVLSFLRAAASTAEL